MRSLPDTRSRRLSDSKLRKQNLKRLKNGFVIPQITTRSQAKISKPAIGRRKVTSNSKSCAKTATSRRNEDNFHIHDTARLRGDYIRYPGRQNGQQDDICGNQQRKSNGLSNGLGHCRIGSTRILHKNQNNCFFRKSLKSEIKRKHRDLQREEAAAQRAERLKKRRSALWVLNCEAESFLFGETAAEDHEVELPPMSKSSKRRKMRANELGTLLKESPILESKLRSPPLSVTWSPTADDDIEVEQNEISKESDTSENGSPEKVSDTEGVSDYDRIVKNDFAVTTLPLSVFSSTSVRDALPWLSNSSSNCNPHSVRVQNILTSMQWKYSFEELPSDETWYSTFKRQQTNRNSLPIYRHPKDDRNFLPLLLPYETKVLQNRSSKKKQPRLPRKSPRCHASTLAILSSLKNRGRHRSGSLAFDSKCGSGTSLPRPITPTVVTSTHSSEPKSPTANVEIKTKRVYKRNSTSSPNQSCCSSPLRTTTLPPVSPPQLSGFPPVVKSSPVSPSSSTSRMRDLSATQYLWDSIQLLSDPYVIQILAHERFKSPVSDRFNFLPCANSPEPDLPTKCKTAVNRVPGVPIVLSNSFAGAKTFPVSSSPLNPSLFPKCDVSYNTTNNNKNPKNKFKKSVCTTVKCEKQLRMGLNTKNVRTAGAEQNDTGSNGIAINNRFRKSSRKSPVVLVADIFKNAKNKTAIHGENGKTATTTTLRSPTAINHSLVCKQSSREELLFLVEGLPPLPAWPV